jgi:hypothetical protein
MTESPIDPTPLPPPDTSPAAPPGEPPGEPPGTPPRATTAPGFPTWKQSIILIVSGAVLGLTTCVGYLIYATSGPTMGGSEAVAGVAVVVFAACVLATIVGVLMLLWLVGRALFGKPTR